MKNTIKFILALLVYSNIVNSAYSVELPEAMRESMSVSTAGMPSLLNLVVSMAVVIGMIYVTGFIYSKLNIINRSKLNSLNNMNKEKHRFTVLQSLPLGQQRHIYSIEMDGKIFLVGSTPNQISLIKEFENDVNPCDISKELQESGFDAKYEKKSNEINIDELYKKYKN